MLREVSGLLRTCALLVAGLGVGLSAVPAWADPPTGSRLGSHTQSGPAMTDRDKAGAAKQMGSCLYNRKKAAAESVLLASSKDALERATSKLFGEIYCFNAVFSNEMVEERRVSFPPEVLRGVLAERAIEVSRREVAALAPLPLQPKYERSWFNTTGRALAVDEMGACIADVNPAGISELIQTPPLSPAEKTAFGALNESLAKCLRAGTRLQANRQSLRAALADALFQRLRAPALSPAPASLEASKR